jgi:hypothetical protein
LILAAEWLARGANDKQVYGIDIPQLWMTSGVYDINVLANQASSVVIQLVGAACNGIVVHREQYAVSTPAQRGSYRPRATEQINRRWSPNFPP